MQKIKSLFKRDYEGSRQVYNEIVPGAEWVTAGEGVATVKWDGTCCMIRGGALYKRYDRKLTKSANRRKKKNASFVPTLDDFKPAPDGWEAAEPKPNQHTGHWPGWLQVDESRPENKYHIEGFKWLEREAMVFDGTYELIGEKVQGNPYGIYGHRLWVHGTEFTGELIPPRSFDGLREWFAENAVEGIVWHHEDGRMVKIKRRDFGLPWPGKE